jgi:glycosyltransferase involved in cell wall biosynthesis
VNVLVAVIAYNEEKNIRSTLENLLAAGGDYDVVVIDNGSSDDTRSICLEMGVPVVSHCTNTGSSMGTVKTYFLYAYRNDYDVLCQFDGDGQHLAGELRKIIEPVAKGEADYVIGSRFLEREGFQSSFMRRIGIRLFSILDSFFIGHRVTDVTSGFRAYGRTVIRFFATRYQQEIIDTSQLLLMSHFSGARIVEVPVMMKDREHGASEYNLKNSIGFVLYGLVNVLGSWLQRKQVGPVGGGVDGH